MTVVERNVESSVRSAEGLRWFRGYLRGLLDAGLSHAELEDVLRHVHDRFQRAGNEQLADFVLDGLDILTGWCGPEMAVREPQNVQ